MTNFIKSLINPVDDRQLNADKLWKLTIGDIHFKTAEDIICSLGSFFSPQQVKDEQLKKGWQVTGRETLITTLAWLEQQGHSSIYNKTSERSAGFELNFYLKHHDTLKNTSLLAWDLGRFATLARLGQYAGYITEDEYWAWMEKVAPRLQAAYKSWKQFAEHFLLGREFWLRRENGNNVKRAVHFLLRNRHSPWRMLKWNTPLNTDSELAWHHDNPFYVDMNASEEDKNLAIYNYYSRMVEHDSKNPCLLNAFGVFLEKHLHNKEQAIQCFKQAIQYSTDFEPPYANLLSLYTDEEQAGGEGEKPQKIKKLLQDWIKQFPDSADAHYHYADWLFDSQSDNHPLIEQHYRRAIEIEPRQEWHYESYGEFLAIAKNDYTLAKKMFQRAIDLNPEFQPAYDNLARAEEALRATSGSRL